MTNDDTALARGRRPSSDRPSEPTTSRRQGQMIDREERQRRMLEIALRVERDLAEIEERKRDEPA